MIHKLNPTYTPKEDGLTIEDTQIFTDNKQNQALSSFYIKDKRNVNLLSYFLLSVFFIAPCVALFFVPLPDSWLSLFIIASTIFLACKIISVLDRPHIFQKMMSKFKSRQLLEKHIHQFLTNQSNIQTLIKLTKEFNHSGDAVHYQTQLIDLIENYNKKPLLQSDIDFINEHINWIYHIHKKMTKEKENEEKIKKLHILKEQFKNPHEEKQMEAFNFIK